MTYLLPAVAVTFAAFCVWLMVRIVNRRERWAKWTLAGVVGLTIVYVLGVGPACWLVDRDRISRNSAARIYAPLARIGLKVGGARFEGVLVWYGKLYSPPDRYDSPIPLPYRPWQQPFVKSLVSDARPTDPVWEALKAKRRKH